MADEPVASTQSASQADIDKALAQAGQQGGDQSLPEGVTQQGDTLRAVGEETPKDEPLKLPEGYDTPEAFAKAVLDGTYKPQQAASEEATTKGQEGKAAPTDAEVAEIVKTSTEGMTPEMATAVTPFVEAFAKTGTLTDQQVQDAAKATGFSVEMVRQYMDGALYRSQNAATQQAAANAPVLDLMGGQAGWDAFNKWASEGGLTQDQQDAFNDASKNNPKAAVELAKSYHGMWQAAGGGKAPVDLTREGTSTGGGSITGYASSAEMERDMNDPRYANDEAFRNKVAARVGASSF